MEEYNVYCDETCHLEHDESQFMVIGCIYCQKEKVKDINDRIKRLKQICHRPIHQEIKWTSISPTNKNIAEALVQDFFVDDDLSFRAIIVDKSKLDCNKFNKQTFQSFYYVAYYEMIKAIISPTCKYNIYLDIKDTNSQEKIDNLKSFLDHYVNANYNRKLVCNVQHVRSHEIQLLQITDILIGAISHDLRQEKKSHAKNEIISLIKKSSGYDFSKTTLLRESKFNLLRFPNAEDNYVF